MTNKIMYADCQHEIRDILQKYAEEGNKLTYSELSKKIGIPPQGPWKQVLDLIAAEERDADRPDITFLLINKKTKMPSQIDLQNSKQPTAEQMERAEREWKRIFSYYKNTEI